MASTFCGCVRFQASPHPPCSRPASMSCVPIAPSPSRGRCWMASSKGFFMPCSFDRFELTTLDEEVEELRVRFQAAVLDALHEIFQLLPFAPKEQRDASAFDRGVADLHDALTRQIRDQT